LRSRKLRICVAGKYDGTRCVVVKEKGEVTLQNRHGIPYTVRLPEIVDAAKAIPGSFIIDGEVVYIRPETGREEFTGSQRRCSTQFPDVLLRRQYPVVFKGLRRNKAWKRIRC